MERGPNYVEKVKPKNLTLNDNILKLTCPYRRSSMKAQGTSGAAVAVAATLGPLSGSAILLLGVFVFLLAANVLAKRSRRGRSPSKPPPPGPSPWPILGSMHYLGMYDIPFEGFTYLKKFYGDVFAMRMGSTPCVVLNTPEHRDEAIVAKASDFDGRPNFVRFTHLFGGRSSNCESEQKINPQKRLSVA